MTDASQWDGLDQIVRTSLSGSQRTPKSWAKPLNRSGTTTRFLRSMQTARSSQRPRGLTARLALSFSCSRWACSNRRSQYEYPSRIRTVPALCPSSVTVVVRRELIPHLSIIPVFAWPLDFCAQLLGFLFLYNTGISSLQQGFESSKSIPRVKSLLAALLITSAAQLVPVFLFDGSYHFGALWSFALPALLFVTPTKGGDTVVMIICDTVFAQLGEVLRSVVPEALQVSEVEVWDSTSPFPRRLSQDEQGSQLVLIGGVLIALLL